jgi:spermidine/putrescine transport system ATP-binding protein
MVGVTKVFGDVVAVDDASFAVEDGEFFSLLGPSGCGKTTTLRIVAGFEEPTNGELYLKGREATQIPAFRRDTNLVFQTYALFPHMTVFDNVAFGPRRAKVSRSETKKRVMEALETVRMGHLSDRLPNQMSGGQQQRVGLARALVNRPAILLLDEPLGSLDLKLRQEMQIELKRIQREVGISFMYVTHDQEEALTMSDRIAVMLEGRIEQIGTAEEIYLEPRNRFVANFIGKANLLTCTIEAAGALPEVKLSDGTRFRAGSVSGPEGVTPVAGSEVTLVLRPEQLRVSSERPPGSTLFEATVTDLIFQGAAQRYELDVASGERVAAITPVQAPADRARPGDRVWVTWDEARGHIVLEAPGEDAAAAAPDEPDPS